MDKVKYIANLFDLYIEHENRTSPYIIPEYNEHLFEFITDTSEEILGKDVSDLVYDVATGQCDLGKVNGNEYPLTTIEELLTFINDAKLI